MSGYSGVVVGYCHPENVSGMFCSSLARLLIWDASGKHRITKYGDVIMLQSSPRIASARNEIVGKFLESSADWLFMVDADMVFAPDVVDKLVESAEESNVKIMGGLAFVYHKASGKVEPTLKILTSSDPIQFEPAWQFPPDAVVKVDATGAACVLIHRTVFEDVELKHGKSQYTWFAESEKDGQEFGEDVTFFLRAKSCGHSVYVNTGIEFGHMKSRPLTLDDYVAYRQSLKEDGDEDKLAAKTIKNLGKIHG